MKSQVLWRMKMKKNDDHPDGFDFDTVCREYTEEVSYEYDPNLDLQQEEQGGG